MILVSFVAVVLMAVLNAVPITFFGMIFLGNLGVHFSFLSLLPGALALNCLKNNLFTFTVNNSKEK